MEWLGGVLSGVLGALFGVWSLGVADRLRCASGGLFGAREERVCASQPRGWLVPTKQEDWIAVAVAGALWVSVWGMFWVRQEGIAWWIWHVVFLSGLFALALVDVRWRILPMEVVVALGVVAMLTRVLFLNGSWAAALQGLLILGLFFGLQTWLSRGKWLGSGDPLLGAAIGASLGWPLAGMAVYFTYMSAIPFLVIHFWRMNTVSRIRWPFAPLLFLGTWLAVAFGEMLQQWMFRW